MPTKELTYAAKSTIHGKGLFARKRILKDTVIGHLQGQITKQDGMYVLWLDDKTGFKVSCDLKYINHSNSPNACYYDDRTVVALSDIATDEEITHNYETE